MSCQQKFSTWLLSLGTLAMKYSTGLPHKSMGCAVIYFIHLSFFMGHPRKKFASAPTISEYFIPVKYNLHRREQMKATLAGDTGLVTELWEDVFITECNTSIKPV